MSTNFLKTIKYEWKWILVILLNLNFPTTTFLPYVAASTIKTIPPADLIFDVGDLGRIKGVAKKTVGELKRDFIGFYGIPYANCSNHDTRFLPAADITTPLPVTPGLNYFDASFYFTCCPQAPSIFCLYHMAENCLQVYISTPLTQAAIDPENLLPVILYIHGGGFNSGTFSLYNADRLLERDVILVSIHYRLGVLGFFSLDDEAAPGNAGMYDMVQAVKWVKKYIKYFGGDANLITVAGQSAGSVAVTHLMLSNMTKGEDTSFQRAIAHSGSALTEWGTTTAEKGKTGSLNIASRVGCYDPALPYDAKQIVTCMKAVPSKDLVQALNDHQVDERFEGRLGFDPTSPVIQSFAPVGTEKFLDAKPSTILEEGRQSKIPLMMGSTRHDGSYVLGVVYKQILSPHDHQNNATFLREMAVPQLLSLFGVTDETGEVFDCLAEAYVGAENINSGNFTLMTPGMIDLTSVFSYKAPQFETLRLHSRVADSYLFSFDFKGSKSLFDLQIGSPAVPFPGGVSHSDDLIYLFKVVTIDLVEEADVMVSQRMVNFWANFAYSGNPNIGEPGRLGKNKVQEDWPSYTEALPVFAVHNRNQTDIIHDLPNLHWIGLANELMPDISPPTTTRVPKCTKN